LSYQNEFIIPLCIGLSQVFHIDLTPMLWMHHGEVKEIKVENQICIKKELFSLHLKQQRTVVYEYIYRGAGWVK
jgi:hypothetical protein